MKSVGSRVRFSPAPSGLLHLGGARTALFNHLAAHDGGVFVLRFEDTDLARSDSAFEARLLEDLGWLGIEWAEGPDIGGPHAPYRQSERGELYAAALGRLEAARTVYRCFCHESHLAQERDLDAAEGRAPRYRGSCSMLEPEEAAARAAAGEPFCWRFSVPAGRDVTVDDRVHGSVTFRSDDIGDFVVARSDGGALYDLACVVDDSEMGITLVIRGDDHLSNTPRQLLLFEALGIEPPAYAHVPLVMGPDGRPLSKSRGAESVAALRDQGYLPAAIVNHLALLGWSDPAGREVLTPDELARAFSLERVSASAPAHDPARLRWLNRRHMAALPHAERIALVAARIPELAGVGAAEAAELLVGDVDVASDVDRLIAGVPTMLEPDEEARAALASPVADDAIAIARAALDALPALDVIRDALKAAGLPLREALPAVRAALTGRAHGLPMATLEVLLGYEEASARLLRAPGA